MSTNSDSKGGEKEYSAMRVGTLPPHLQPRRTFMNFWPSIIDLLHKLLIFLTEHFVLKPGQGLLDVGLGLALAAPEIAQAVVQAVDRQLSFSSRVRVRSGLAKIQNGWLLLRWPLLALALVIIAGWYGLFVVSVAVFFVATAQA
jgi:hypothetical protein